MYLRKSRDASGEEREICLKTQELREALGGEVSLDAPDVVLWIKDYLAEQTEELLHPAV